jgi:putative ABC transport system permease protein
MLFVKSEWSFDRFHTKGETIHRAWLEEHYQGELFRNTATPVPLRCAAGQSARGRSCLSCTELGAAIRLGNVTYSDPVTWWTATFSMCSTLSYWRGPDKILS